jgi:23S rRNA (uridine2552-2'-O)-methyltransferase
MSRFVVRDKYFQKAKEDGYRARSAYKLKEIQNKYHPIKRGDCVLDLGCAPGSFLQVISELVGPAGLVVGIDILPVGALSQKNVVAIQSDIRSIDVTALTAKYAPLGFDAVTCDIAPNLSGIRDVDDRNMAELYGAVRSVVVTSLKKKGHFVLKAFYSEDFKATKTDLSRLFRSVLVFKPDASRSVSSEVYLVNTDKK